MRSKRTIIAIYSLLAGLVLAGYVSHRLAAREVALLVDRRARMLATPVAELRMDGKPLKEAIAELSRTSGVPIAVDSKVLEAARVDPAAPMHLCLFDLPLSRVLDLTLIEAGRQTSLTWEWRGDSLWITTWDQREKQSVVIQAYEVADLACTEIDFQDAPTFDGCFGNPGQKGGLFSGSNFVDRRDHRYDDVIKLITTTVAPETWRDAGGTIGGIDAADNRLIVHQTVENQQEVAKLLRALHEHSEERWPEPID